MTGQVNILVPFAASRSVAVFISLVALVGSTRASECVIHRFKGGRDGYYSTASLLADKTGNLYGTTAYGGTSGSCVQGEDGCGTVFELKPPARQGEGWAETVLYRFQGGTDGYAPKAALVADEHGNLYGTTTAGGSHNFGTVFELQAASSPGGRWTHRVLYDFGNRLGDGVQPNGVVFDKQGNLYGTTFTGGHCDRYDCYGTVFELVPRSGGPWKEILLHRFLGSELISPLAGLILDKKGNLYGTAYDGGTSNFGGVFELKPPHGTGHSWTEITLHDFNGNDGGAPAAALIFDGAGNLYGTTLAGGATNWGAVFQLAPPMSPGGSWTESVLHSFTRSDGEAPVSTLVFDGAGNLYGTTWDGGDFQSGTVFRLSPSAAKDSKWRETVLHTFGNAIDGAHPKSGLVYGSDGALYGTTTDGGTQKNDKCALDGYAWTCGAVFQIAP